MASIDQARKAGGLIAAMDTLESWAAEFDGSKQPYIGFAQIDERSGREGEQSSTWEGELVLPRETALRMLAREIEAIRADLTALGIADTEPEPAQ